MSSFAGVAVKMGDAPIVDFAAHFHPEGVFPEPLREWEFADHVGPALATSTRSDRCTNGRDTMGRFSPNRSTWVERMWISSRRQRRAPRLHRRRGWILRAGFDSDRLRRGGGGIRTVSRKRLSGWRYRDSNGRNRLTRFRTRTGLRGRGCVGCSADGPSQAP